MRTFITQGGLWLGGTAFLTAGNVWIHNVVHIYYSSYCTVPNFRGTIFLADWSYGNLLWVKDMLEDMLKDMPEGYVCSLLATPLDWASHC